MVRGDRVPSQPFLEIARDPFRQAAGVDEDEGDAVFLDELGEPVEDLLPHFVRHDRFERRAWQLERQLESTAVSLVDHGALASSTIRPDADQELRHLFDGMLSRREADALERAARDVLEPFEAERQVRAAARLDHRVDLVHDDRPHRAEHVPAALGGEQQVERLGRGHQDMGRALQHRGACRTGGVTGSNRRGNLHRLEPHMTRRFGDALARLDQVLVDIGAQRLER